MVRSRYWKRQYSFVRPKERAFYHQWSNSIINGPTPRTLCDSTIKALVGYNGNTALHCSGAQDHVSIVQLLLEAEARTDIMNDDMLTPAMLSAQEGNLECLHFLLPCDNNCAQRNQYTCLTT